jgi:hypothetical protein
VAGWGVGRVQRRSGGQWLDEVPRGDMRRRGHKQSSRCGRVLQRRTTGHDSRVQTWSRRLQTAGRRGGVQWEGDLRCTRLRVPWEHLWHLLPGTCQLRDGRGCPTRVLRERPHQCGDRCACFCRRPIRAAQSYHSSPWYHTRLIDSENVHGGANRVACCRRMLSSWAVARC